MDATYDTAAIRRRAVESEAEIWLYGNVASAERMFGKALEFARLQDADGRRFWSAGYWHANDIIGRAAITVVQIELGEPLGWHGGPARLNPVNG
jgi:hypothetical protein